MRENPEEMIAIVRVLGDAGYMDLSPECIQRRYSVARRLARDGMTAGAVRLLLEYAKSVADRPTALFATWLRTPSGTRTKVDEMMRKSQWVSQTLRRLDDIETSGDAAPIISLRDRRRSM